MLSIPVPYERLSFFLKEVGIQDEDMRVMDPHKTTFINKKEEFGRFFYGYFYNIPKTRIFLEHEQYPKRLEHTLANWFGALFEKELDEEFLGYLWKSGLRHVEVNLDQRYVNLGYSAARKYCHQIIEAEIPLEERQQLMVVVDKMLDFCVLVATDSYVTATSRCDLEIIKGVAHQVRNPITVIGGNILRLRRKIEGHGKENRAFESILRETKRLERMVSDISVYNEVVQEESEFEVFLLQELLERVIAELEREREDGNVEIEMDLAPGCSRLEGDPKELAIMFRYLLENSFEAVDRNDPRIIISCQEEVGARFVRIEIFNTGTIPESEDLDNLLTPFYSLKPAGTGFGLPTARRIAHKNLGEVTIERVDKRGVKCTVILPSARPLPAADSAKT